MYQEGPRPTDDHAVRSVRLPARALARRAHRPSQARLRSLLAARAPSLNPLSPAEPISACPLAKGNRIRLADLRSAFVSRIILQRPTITSHSAPVKCQLLEAH